jgi:ABC-type multidrug transport system fused ATPase/permease subunit
MMRDTSCIQERNNNNNQTLTFHSAPGCSDPIKVRNHLVTLRPQTISGMTIQQVVRKFKLPILLVLVFVLLENISWIVEPTFFGKLLDALITKFYAKEKVDYILPFVLWVAIYLFNVIGGALHRFFSGRVYSRIYADTATSVMKHSKHDGLPVSKIFARAELASEYIVFLRDRLPEVTWQICATFGAITALFFYDWRIALLALVVIFPIALIINIYRKKILDFQRELHDTREAQYRMFESGDTSSIHEYYYRMVQPQSKIAKWSSINYLVIKVLLMLIFVGVLFIAVDVDRFSTGNIYAIVSYIWTFIASTDYLPGLMESLTAVKELNTRLRQEEI